MIAEPTDLDNLLSVAAAIIDHQGRLIAANPGFLHLVDLKSRHAIGARVNRCFIQPDFHALTTAAPSGCAGELYRGPLTIGEISGRSRTLRGCVHRVPEGIRLLAEHDIEDLEKIGAQIEQLSEQSLVDQRALKAENAELRRREARLRESSLTDELTGIGNRRALDEALAAEISRVGRTGEPLSALMADLDHFKRVNDSFGHPVGDQVLAHFAHLLKSTTRPTDVVARFGGEEFLVLMPHTTLAQAAEIAERIRNICSRETVPPLLDPVTASFGVCQYVNPEASETFLRRIDAALYQAKDSGRNRVVSG